MSGLQQNLADVLERVERACDRAGRPAGDVALIAVSKTWPAELVVELAACGQRLFGENRVQEAQAKIPLVAAAASPSLAWHLIGSLQRNKARHAVGLFDLLHGVDSEPLLLEIDRRARAAGLVQRILLQVNVAGEASKAGAAPDAVEPLLRAAGGLDHVEVRGLMTIPPPAERPADSRRWFDELRVLRDELVSRVGRPLPELSMGMSGDFETAILAGATLVRVGTAIFGARATPAPGRNAETG